MRLPAPGTWLKPVLSLLGFHEGVFHFFPREKILSAFFRISHSSLLSYLLSSASACAGMPHFLLPSTAVSSGTSSLVSAPAHAQSEPRSSRLSPPSPAPGA